MADPDIADRIRFASTVRGEAVAIQTFTDFPLLTPGLAAQRGYFFRRFAFLSSLSKYSTRIRLIASGRLYSWINFGRTGHVICRA
jgi:hypothetical protein